MFFCNFCELFLLLFILLYVLFQSAWIIIFILAGFIGIIYNLQDIFVYHPQEPPESKTYIEQPSLYNLPYEVVELRTNDSVKLHSYLLKQPLTVLGTAPTIVFFHGNAGNIGQRLSIAHYLYNYCECNVFLVEYRGYGLSEGAASEAGFYLDAESSITHLLTRNDIDTSKIIAFGQSIGGAVVIELATKFNDQLFAFIVENTFTSLPDIGRELFGGIPGVSFLPDFCFKNQYQSIDKIRFLTLPSLFISGQADSMIPPQMMKILFEKSNSKLKRLLKIEAGDHNDTWLRPGYFQFITKFIQETSANKENLSNTGQAIKPINSQIWHVNAQ
jgi:fermentation-respiration switch protein FrsA (DUF1100 family)